jgi:hypothetical protein
MRDLKRHLRDIEGFAPPNLWNEITARERRPLRSAPERHRRPVAAIVALVVAAAGFVFASRALLPSRDSGPPQDGDAGLKTVVARGSVSGQSWTLVTYEREDAFCVDLQLEGGSGGGCGFEIPEKRDLGLIVGSQAGLPKTIIHGVVSKRVATLVVRLDGDEQTDVQIIEGPSGFDVNFFAEFLRPDAEGTVEARDDQGALLQRERLRPLSEVRDDKAFIEEVLDEHNLTVYYPEGWNRAPDTLTPHLGPARELLSLGTYGLSPGGEDCGQLPERAIESIGPTDAFITLQEASSSADFPPRPARFTAENGEVAESSGCLDNVEDISFLKCRFEDEARSFVAYTAIANSASAQTRSELWQILNALIFCDPASPPGDCL